MGPKILHTEWGGEASNGGGKIIARQRKEGDSSQSKTS